MAFLTGLRAFSAWVFQPLIVSNAVTYGALGTVLIVQSWLIGVGWVVYGGQLFGRWVHDAWLRAGADTRRGHRQPGGMEQGHEPPGGEENEPTHGDPGTPPGQSASPYANPERKRRCRRGPSVAVRGKATVHTDRPNAPTPSAMRPWTPQPNGPP